MKYIIVTSDSDFCYSSVRIVITVSNLGLRGSCMYVCTKNVCMYVCHQGGPKLCYKDSIKANMKSCGIDFLHFEKLSSNRANWRSLCHSSLQQFEENRIRHLQAQQLFLPTSHLFANLVARNAVQKQVLNPTRDTEDTKESHHRYQWTCHHNVCMYVCMYVYHI